MQRRLRSLRKPFVYVWAGWKTFVFAVCDGISGRRFRRKLRLVEQMTEVWATRDGRDEEEAA